MIYNYLPQRKIVESQGYVVVAEVMRAFPKIVLQYNLINTKNKR